MGILGAIAAPAATLASSALGMISANQANIKSKQAANVAWERDVDAYKHRYQWTTTDMRNAGLNPILAASGGFNVGSGINAPQPSVHMAQIPSDFATSALSLSKSREAEANIDKIKSESAKAIQETVYLGQKCQESISKTYANRAQAKMVSAEEKKLVQEVKNLQQLFQRNVKLFKHQIDKAYQDVYVAESEEHAKNSITNLNNQKRELVQNTASEIMLKLNQLRRVSDVYGTEYGKNLTWINETLKAYEPLLRVLSSAIIGGSIMLK